MPKLGIEPPLNHVADTNSREGNSERRPTASVTHEPLR
jgi:hypothetical protein